MEEKRPRRIPENKKRNLEVFLEDSSKESRFWVSSFLLLESFSSLEVIVRNEFVTSFRELSTLRSEVSSF